MLARLELAEERPMAAINEIGLRRCLTLKMTRTNGVISA